MAHLNLEDLERTMMLERKFYGGVGVVWLLSHAMLLLLGNTSVFRSSWLSLAEMEVRKEKAFEVIGDAKLCNGQWTPKIERLTVGRQGD